MEDKFLKRTVCEYCGKEMEAGYRSKRFCSDKCRVYFNREAKSKNKIQADIKKLEQLTDQAKETPIGKEVMKEIEKTHPVFKIRDISPTGEVKGGYEVKAEVAMPANLSKAAQLRWMRENAKAEQPKKKDAFTLPFLATPEDGGKLTDSEVKIWYERRDSAKEALLNPEENSGNLGLKNWLFATERDRDKAEQVIREYEQHKLKN